jgi:dihydropteroate synthase
VRGRALETGASTLIMGILNVTPDSFSDGGRFFDPGAAVAHGKKMAEEGADIIDVGGESTRPGSDPVPEEQEIARVVPVVARLARETAAIISVDTTKARVAEEAVAAGAAIINDVSALGFDPRMAQVASSAGAGVVLMHMLGRPKDMQGNPVYSDLIGEISVFLAGACRAAVRAGVREDAIVCDPGIGFGKTAAHNLEILRRLGDFGALGRPILVGPSRKSFIGTTLGGLPADERLEGTAAAVALAIAGGAAIVRVHDVMAMKRVARLADAVLNASG